MSDAVITKQGYKQIDVWIIPEDWEMVQFDDITEFIKCGIASTPKYVNEGIPFLSAQNVSDGKLIFDNFKLISQELHKQLTTKTKPKRNDILYSRVGAGYGQAALVNIDNDFSVYVSLTHLRMCKECFPPFYVHLLNSAFCKKQAQNGVFQGGGVPNLNVEIVKNFTMLLPPLPEQQTIAQVLSDTDELIEKTQALIDKKRNIKTGAMQELLKPKEGWEEKFLDEIFEFSAGGDVDKESFSSIKTCEYPYPIYANALTNEGIYGYSSKYTIENEAITITGRGDVGKVFYRDKYFTPIVRLITAIPFKGIDTKYMGYACSRINFANESTGVPQLTVPQVKKYKITFSTNLYEQKRIAQILSDMDTEIEKLEEQLNKYKSLKTGMMQELLTGKTRLV